METINSPLSGFIKSLCSNVFLILLIYQTLLGWIFYYTILQMKSPIHIMHSSNCWIINILNNCVCKLYHHWRTCIKNMGFLIRIYAHNISTQPMHVSFFFTLGEHRVRAMLYYERHVCSRWRVWHQKHNFLDTNGPLISQEMNTWAFFLIFMCCSFVLLSLSRKQRRLSLITIYALNFIWQCGARFYVAYFYQTCHSTAMFH
jgi:hypothetical protein